MVLIPKTGSVDGICQQTDSRNRFYLDFNRSPPVGHFYFCFLVFKAGRPGSSEVPRNPLTRWNVSSTPANGIFLTKKLKNKNKNAQRVEND